jgi:hypothetical protein
MKKNKKHLEVVTNFDESKRKHLDKLATKMLKHDEKNQKLKDKRINKDILNMF